MIFLSMKKNVKYTIFTIIGLMLGCAVCFARQEKTITVDNMPPSVVKTVPRSGDTRVDPSLKEIRVTFSKDMMTDRMWSWAMNSKETFPQCEADGVYYLPDKRTCVLPVKLEPNKTYVIWINSRKFDAFRDRGNRPAAPYLLVFETRP